MDTPHILFQNDLNQRALLFENPEEIIIARSGDEVYSAFAQLEEARNAGKWSAGFVSYEAGYTFEEKLRGHIQTHRNTPLLCFGIFEGPNEVNIREPSESAEKSTDFFTDFHPSWDLQTYQKKFEILRNHIAKGDCYQANLTFPIDGKWHGNAKALFDYLTTRQPVRYSAYVDLCEPVIISRSPELFFKIDQDGWIETHPMKGTAPRHEDAEADQQEIELLKSSTKTQAENVMIVDLLRNDISRIIHPETLDVPKLFEVESYPSVHQMISRIRGKTLDQVTIGEIFSALFPCGSITGAPKLRSMEILHKLEQEPRGIYCGSIGYIGPGKQMLFNVAIRTLSLFDDNHARLNVGGGIIWDSIAEDEYAEALLKAQFVMGK